MACTDEHRGNRERFVYNRAMQTADLLEDDDVTLQMRAADDPSRRAEVLQRIMALVESARGLDYAINECWGDAEKEEEKRIGEEVKSLYLALTGYQLTEEELSNAARDAFDTMKHRRADRTDPDTPQEGTNDGQH